MNLYALQNSAASTYVFAVRALVLLIVTCCAGYFVLSLNSPLLTRMAGQGMLNPRENRQPYALQTNDRTSAYLSFTLRYYAWQNGVFAFEMNDACVTSVFIKPEGLKAHIIKLPDSMPLCGEARIDLGPFLLPGINDIALEIRSYKPQETDVYAAPVLLGTHAASTLAVLCIFTVFALTLFVAAQRAGLDRGACLILVAGFTCYALLLHLRPNLEYTNDHVGHIAYIRYMLENAFLHPYGYDGWEHFHPPLYYFLGSLMFGFGENGGPFAPLTMVRMLSLFFYTLFMLFGLLTLRAVSGGKGAVYYLGALLLIFWPIGPVVSTRISNDVPVYAFWAIAYYCLVRWFRDMRLGWLQLAVAFTGIAFMFKSSVFMLIAVTGACGLSGLATKRLLWRDLIRGRSLIAFGVFILGAFENTGKYIGLMLHGEDTYDYLTTVVDEKHPLGYYTGFSISDYIAHPVVTYDREPTYLNYFLKTVLYNEQQLDDLQWLPSTENGLLLALLAVVSLATVLRFIRDGKGRWLLSVLIFGTLIPPVGPFVFMLMKRYMFCQSFRFIVPALIAFLALYVRTLEAAGDVRPPRLLYGCGITVAGLMAFISILMNGWLYTHGHFQ